MIITRVWSYFGPRPKFFWLSIKINLIHDQKKSGQKTNVNQEKKFRSRIKIFLIHILFRSPTNMSNCLLVQNRNFFDQRVYGDATRASATAAIAWQKVWL